VSAILPVAIGLLITLQAKVLRIGEQVLCFQTRCMICIARGVTFPVSMLGVGFFKSAIRKEKASLAVQIHFGAGFQTNTSLSEDGMIGF
jgi:hypothetical protein